MTFPRSLSTAELEFIRWLLPEHSEVYARTLKTIESEQVIGEGRWGLGDLMIGKNNIEIDRTLSMMPVIAIGDCITNHGSLSISIHEPNLDDMIEIQFSGVFPLPEHMEVISGWTYSYWHPNLPCPSTGEAVREVILQTSANIPRYTIVLSPSNKTLWCYDHSTKFNQLLTVTGFMDELLRTHGIRDAAIVTNPSKMFEELNNFSDNEIRKAFSEYSKSTVRKFDLSDIVIEQSSTKTSLISKLFGQ